MGSGAYTAEQERIFQYSLNSEANSLPIYEMYHTEWAAVPTPQKIFEASPLTFRVRRGVRLRRRGRVGSKGTINPRRPFYFTTPERSLFCAD